MLLALQVATERTESEGKSRQEESLEHGWMELLINHKGACRRHRRFPVKVVAAADHFNPADSFILLWITYPV